MSLRYVCVAHHDMYLVLFSIKIHMFYFNIMSFFLRVAATAATDRVSQSRFSMLEIFGMDMCYI